MHTRPVIAIVFLLWLACSAAVALRGPRPPGGEKAVQVQQPLGARQAVGSAAGPVLSDVEFDYFSLEDGLPSNNIRAITQDSLGFLWLGTENGLVRYDGSTFKVFTHPSGLGPYWKAFCATTRPAAR